MVILDEIYDILSGYNYRFSDEKRLQEGIAAALKEHKVEFTKEYTLKKGVRIDFLVKGGIGIEVKVDGSVMAVNRQLQQYALHEAVTGILLVTSRGTHNQVERRLADTPIRVLCLNLLKL